MVIELLKAVLFGIVEGVTEWLPISSTGHLILLDEFITLNMSDAFKSMFDVVIQLGAILAVIVLFFHKLNPFAPSKSGEEKKQTWQCGWCRWRCSRRFRRPCPENPGSAASRRGCSR